MVNVLTVVIVISFQRYHHSWLLYKKPAGYCYHLVNVFGIGLAQSDHIKRLPLQLQAYHLVEFFFKLNFLARIYFTWITFIGPFS
jgi:hypothetical protein